MPRIEGPLDGSTFWNLLDALLPVDGDALDLGTGTGRVALRVAPGVRRVVGIDVDASSLDAARWDAQRRSVTNVEFVQADAETADLLAFNGSRPYALITARLFLSPAILGRVASLLAPGGHFVAEALEAENWKEAGGSRYNLAAEDVVRSLRGHGLHVEEARVEFERHRFADPRGAEAHLKDRRLWTKWKADGRWETLRARVRKGGTLTDARLVAWARRPSG